jgi:glutamate carboxypeptidase
MVRRALAKVLSNEVRVVVGGAAAILPLCYSRTSQAYTGRSMQQTLPSPLLTAAHAQQSQALARLRTLVELETPTESKRSVDGAGEWVTAWAQELGGRVERHRFADYGDSLHIRFGARDRAPLLLLGHLDTVWPLGTLAEMPWRESEGRLYGPGVLDMKAGVVMALAALRLLQDQDTPPPAVELLLHGEEEVGSPVSRALTESIARPCRAVYVLEPAQGPQGAYKTARKGVGDYRLTVRGVAAHAGVDFPNGHSAVLELARQLAAVAALTDPARGITLNPGVVGGGTRSNVVAAEAWAEIDIRIAHAEDAARVDAALRALQPGDRHCTLTVAGGINRPPMERTRGIGELFARAQREAEALGFALEEASTGGGSDGNFTAALGVPTLDGMGAVGEGAHARHEHIVLEHWAPRVALLAAMLR